MMMMMMIMTIESIVDLVCDPGIGFHLILQSLRLSHFTVTWHHDHDDHDDDDHDNDDDDDHDDDDDGDND